MSKTTMSLQEVADRMEINNLLIDYCDAVDRDEIDRFDDIFTPDALIDYSVFGGPRGGLDEIKAFLKEVLPQVPVKQHMIANSRVWLDGDTARSRTLCFNPMSVPVAGDQLEMTYYGLWYVDTLVRTEAGWRISERLEEKSYIFKAAGSLE